jgi:1-acyl-sn-glycerol-3-phosphate acyltransferase
MLYPKNNKLISGFFHRYVAYLVKRNFQTINYDQVQLDPHRSVLLLANHFSWWDGFLMYWINHIALKKNFRIMVLEDTLRKSPILRYLGAYSVLKNSRSMLQSLNYSAELLNDPNNLVLIFPQARLYSNFVNDIHFEKGVNKVIKDAAGKFQYVFAANFIENFQHKKPSAYVHIKVTDAVFDGIDQLKQAFDEHYALSKEKQTQIVI